MKKGLADGLSAIAPNADGIHRKECAEKKG
jgi:hypothetical protein